MNVIQDEIQTLYADNIPIPVHQEEQTIKAYIDGDLDAAVKCYRKLQTKSIDEQLPNLEKETKEDKYVFLLAYCVIAVIVGICMAMNILMTGL